MISESRDDFTQWIIDSYNSLHDALFEGGKFKMNYVLSGEMLCYLLVKPWYKRVNSDEYFKEDADIRQEVDERQVEDVRDYLDNPTMDVQAAMVHYFLPTEGDYPAYLDSEIGKSLFSLVLNYGLPERLRFVKEIAGNPKEEMERALEQFPNLKDKVSELDFMKPEAAAIATSNMAICEYFAITCEDDTNITFTNGEHFKTVAQTVRTNLNYYKNVLQFIRDEKEEKYSKIYKAIKTKVEAYFETAAEDILMDVYGEQYLEFFETKSAEFAEQAKKNSSKKKSAE